MRRCAPWGALILGVWLIAAPYVLGFAGMTAALATCVGVGVILVVASGVGLYCQYKGSDAHLQPTPQKA